MGKYVTATATSGQRLSLKVVGANALAPDPLLTGDGYTVLLHGPRRPVLPSASTVLSQATLGRFNAHLFPVDRPASTQTYQLIVDRRQPVAEFRR
jgi:hypothetical protein